MRFDIDRYNNANASVANRVRTALTKLDGSASQADRALRFLVNRLFRSVETITDIYRDRPDAQSYDGAMILRGVYDTHLQALYILKDPVPRSKLYLDFKWVEWHLWRRMLQSNGTRAAQFAVANAGPDSARKDAEYTREFDAVRHLYEVAGRTGKYRQNWFVGNLSDIADAAGYADECRLLTRLLNPIVHSSAFGFEAGLHPTPIEIQWFAWRFLHRTLGRVAEFAGLTFESSDYEHVIRPAYEDAFSPPDFDELMRP